MRSAITLTGPPGTIVLDIPTATEFSRLVQTAVISP